MWLTLSTVLLFTLLMTNGFPQGNWPAQESFHPETENNEALSPSRSSGFLAPNEDDVLWRRKRGEGIDAAKTFQNSWDEKQKGIKQMKELQELRRGDSGEDNGYNSLTMKWISKWSLGPIDRRQYKVDTDSRLRYGYPLSTPRKV